MRLGLFGGTFDPVHLGHLIVAEGVGDALDLHEVLFVPTGVPYLKAGRAITEARHRMAMVELAIAGNPRFVVSDMEIRRPGPTYTLDTLIELRQRRPGPLEILLILGSDSLPDLKRWHRPAEVLELAVVVGVRRPGAGDFAPEDLAAISPEAPRRVMMVDAPLVDVSGSDLRRRVACGRSVRYLVPDAVAGYIRDHGLYLGRQG